MKLLSTALIVICVSTCCTSHNILVVLPTSFWSHYMQVEPIFHALAQRGHNVTALSPFPPKKETPNFKHVIFQIEALAQDLAYINWIEMARSRPHIIFRVHKVKELSDLVVAELLGSTIFQELIRGDNKFDLIFTELFFAQEALVVLGQIFNAPVVTYSSFGYSTDILRFAGAANSFSYIQNKELNYAGPMSLVQKLENALLQCATMIFNEYCYYPSQDALISKYIPGTYPRVSDMLRNISIFFLTANSAVDGTKLYPPNVVEISGLHFKDTSPLDKEIKTIMDSAKGGVIYFSYGSLLKMSDFTKEDIQIFLSVFKQLDQTVLWKTNLNVSDLDVPGNVYIKEWFDQTSVLGHPNCVLFLVHGGISSIMETIKYAVPVVGMSFYGDQIINLANMEHRGYGLRISNKNLTQKSLLWAIKTVLGDPRFKENISKASRIFTDKPMSSLDTAVYWIEYVIRHQGAHHLKPLAAQIPWYQLFLLDVIAIFTTACVVLVYLVFKLVSLLCRKCISESKVLKEKSS